MSVIVLFGRPGSGKDTISNILCEDFRYEHAVLCTTRPKRPNEKEDESYHFLSDDEFIEKDAANEFIWTGSYNDWFYGLSRSDIDKHKDTVIVANPDMFQGIKEQYPDAISFYIESDIGAEIIRQVKRGDRIEEVERRYFADISKYYDIISEVDFVVNNDTDPMDCVDEVLFNIAYYQHPDDLETYMRAITSEFDPVLTEYEY